MSFLSRIVDGIGTGRQAKVNQYNALKVANSIPEVVPIGDASRYRFFSALTGSTGADSGTTNMNVNGGTTAQQFYIAANPDYDIYIMGIVIFIGDDAIVHNRFGNINGVSTGWDLILKEAGEQTFIIKQAKTGGEVIVQSGFFNPFGADATSFELTNYNSTDDAQLTYVNIGAMVPGGVRIGRGTEDRLQSFVRDDFTGLVTFNVRALGYRHYP